MPDHALPGGPPVDLLAHPSPELAFLAAHAAGRSIALRTSGTTSRPRTLVRSTASWVDSFPVVAGLAGYGADTRHWVPGPVTATMNLFARCLAVHAGHPLVSAVADATHAVLTPVALDELLATRDARSGRLRGLQVTVGGDRLEASTAALAEGAGVSLAHYYGAAELSFVAWASGAGQLEAFPGVEVEARDGVLWVRSPYLALPTGDTGPVVDAAGWASVGDRGAVTRSGAGTTVVRVDGRPGLIQTRAASVVVADVEAALRSGGLGELAVVGVPHPRHGMLVAAVVTRRRDEALGEAFARAELSVAQRPRLWLTLPALPRTAVGKVDRDACVRAVLDAHPALPGVRPPGSAPPGVGA